MCVAMKLKVAVFLFLLPSFLSLFTQNAHALPVRYATPQPAYCTVSNSACEQRQPWVAGASIGDDSVSVATGAKASISFLIPDSNIIQTDNELGAGLSVYAPSLFPEYFGFNVGRDYQYFGFVDVDHGGGISFVSSSWINCEWQGCNACSDWPTCTSGWTQSVQSACVTGPNGFTTCPDDRHWQLWNDRTPCGICSLADKYTVEMLWVAPPGLTTPYVWWNYYRNGVVLYTTAYAQPVSWRVGVQIYRSK